jgi:hypothetical protein
MKKVFVIVLTLAMLLAALPVTLVYAAGPSSNVGAIGGLDCNWTWGGTLPALGGYSFTYVAPGNVNAANLANFDTVLLNMASMDLQCDASRLGASAKSDLLAWLATGKKLVIIDSECEPAVDYSWIPYPFTTSNPGATGSFTGTLTNVDDDTLSSDNPADPSYVNFGLITSGTDAVGDMNVMVSMDSHWCVDLTGTNVQGTTGPVQTYARLGNGLMIYNGLDWDYVEYAAGPGTGNSYDNLCKIWKLILDQPWNPDGLPCGVSVTGITLNPPTATNPVGTSHTVTAKVADLLGVGQPGVLVSFLVTAGPNNGKWADVTTDANGNAQWTYSDTGGPAGGTDTITASFTPVGGGPITSAPVTKTWEPGTQPPVVEVGGTIYPNNMLFILISLIGIAAILVAGTAVFMWRRKAQS